MVPTGNQGCAKEQRKRGDAEAVQSSEQSSRALLLPAVLTRNPMCSDQTAAGAHFHRCHRAPHALAKGTFSAVSCQGGVMMCWGSPAPPPFWLQPRDVVPPAGSITRDRKSPCGLIPLVCTASTCCLLLHGCEDVLERINCSSQNTTLNSLFSQGNVSLEQIHEDAEGGAASSAWSVGNAWLGSS